MNTFLIILLTYLGIFTALGQSSSPEKIDQRITTYLGKDLVAKIQKERPLHFNYYYYSLNKSYQLIDINIVQKKQIEVELISKITCIDFNKNTTIYSSTEVENLLTNNAFNLLTSSLKRNKDSPRYYHLVGTKTVIKLEAISTVTKNYKNN